MGDLAVKKEKFREGKNWYIATYEYANNVPLRDGEDAIYVNFVQVTIHEKTTGKFVGIHSFATDFVLHKKIALKLPQQEEGVGRVKMKATIHSRITDTI